jgi:hypothetical protein
MLRTTSSRASANTMPGAPAPIANMAANKILRILLLELMTTKIH